MKRLFILLTITSVLLGILYSCQKNKPFLSKVSAPYVAEAQSHFSTQSRYAANNQSSLKLSLLWDESQLTKYSDKVQMLIVPTKELSTSVKMKSGWQASRYVVFSIIRDKIIIGRIVEVIGERQYINQNIEKIVQGQFKPSISGFSGSIIEYDLNYVKYSGIRYENGRLTKSTAGILPEKYAPLEARSLQRIVSPVAAARIEEYCEYTVLFTHWDDGTTTWETIGYS